MNTARFPVQNEIYDPLRPDSEFWGPAKLWSNDSLLDAAEFDEQCIQNQLGVDVARRCPVCDGHDVRGVAIIYGYPVYTCGTCGVGFVWPQPDDDKLKAFYATFMAHYMGDTTAVYERSHLRNHIVRRQAELVSRLLRGHRSASILEVGAGDGSMLRCLADIGYTNLLGIDMDDGISRLARESLGMDVRCQNFLEFDRSGWSAIMMWATIEHLKDPMAVLKHARGLLRPQGMVIVMTGNNNSVLAKLQRCFDIWMYPPQHLFFFDQQSLIYLLRRSGYDGVRCRMGFQSDAKEVILFLLRMKEAVRVMLGEGRPHWRSINSDLLVAYGYAN